MYLSHDSGGDAEVHNRQVLGDDSPLVFDADGRAEIDDERGGKLLAMHRHLSRAAEPDTCTEVKSDGKVCGRDLPCPYHSED